MYTMTMVFVTKKVFIPNFRIQIKWFFWTTVVPDFHLKLCLNSNFNL